MSKLTLAYIAVPYDVFPYYILYGAEDIGDGYKVCQGLTFDYHKVKRYSKDEWDKLWVKTEDLKEEKRKADEDFKQRAKQLVSF